MKWVDIKNACRAAARSRRVFSVMLLGAFAVGGLLSIALRAHSIAAQEAAPEIETMPEELISALRAVNIDNPGLLAVAEPGKEPRLFYNPAAAELTGVLEESAAEVRLGKLGDLEKSSKFIYLFQGSNIAGKCNKPGGDFWNCRTARTN